MITQVITSYNLYLQLQSLDWLISIATWYQHSVPNELASESRV